MSSKKDELRREYSPDLIESGVRGKYAERHREEGANLVLIDPDLRELFPVAILPVGATAWSRYAAERSVRSPSLELSRVF